jgi:hypothetical protein
MAAFLPKNFLARTPLKVQQMRISGGKSNIVLSDRGLDSPV